MNESRKQFINRLLAADPPSPDARGRYEKEVRAMLEQTLTPGQRWGYLVCALVLALPAALLGWVASLPPPPDAEFMPYIGAVMVLTALALFSVVGFIARAAWKGVADHRLARAWAGWVGVVYVGLLGWLFLLMGRYIPEVLRDDVRVLGLVLLVYAAIAWVRHRVAQAETKTAEKLLEIELHLAELGEALRAHPPGVATEPAPPRPA